MVFSVIIINYNTKEFTRNCINSVYANYEKDELEIIVVDNASNDGSAYFLKEKFKDKIKLIENKKNRGFGTANNQGAKIAKGKYLFFLNSDTLVGGGIFSELKKYLNNNKKAGIVAPKLLLESKNEQPYAFGKFPTTLSTIFEKFRNPSKYSNKPIETDWVSGAALFIRREIFEKINGFDENFFMYFEDIDLCKRVKELGYRIIVNPNISITHICGKSIKQFTKRKKYYYISQDYLIKKHYGSIKMFILKIIRLPYKILILIINK